MLYNITYSKTFYHFLCIMWLCDIWLWHMWQLHITSYYTSLSKSKIIKIKIKTKDKITKSLVFNSNITLSSKFLSNFLKYSSLNFLSFYSYNIFIIYFSSNSPLLKSLFSFISNFSCISCTVINLFYYTKYFTTSFIFLLFNLFILQLY